jgi:hypothetical protein
VPVRFRACLAVLVLGLGAGVVGVATAGRLTVHPPGATERPVPIAARPAERFALDVLREWDDRRAAAWAAGDPTLLARLYTRGSSAGAADLALLGRYRARGLVVRGIRMQLLRARVMASRPRLVVLEVTDRLASAVAYGPAGGARRLPGDVATVHELVLRRVEGEWRMVRVSAGPVQR